MNLIFGGAYQGKLEYAKETFGIKEVYECDDSQTKLDFSKEAVYKLENFVLACLRQDMEAKEYLEANKDRLKDKVIICTDISQGIVPMEEELRAWREMTGRAMVWLGKEADTVTRVFCGLGQKIKG